MRKQCDASYKMVFSSPETVRDLVLGFVPDDWLHGLDWSTLEKVPSSYVTDDLRQRADDVVWRVRANGEWVYCYLLIEFQSTVDPYMAVRVMTYLGLLYQDLIRGGHVLPDRKLPPVLPLVLYNGDMDWTAATDIADLIPAVRGLVARYRPSLSYFLIDQRQYNDEQLAPMKNLVACLIRFEHAPRGEVLCEVVDRLNEWLSDNPELKRAFALLLSEVVSRQSDRALSLPKIQDLKELKMALARRFEEWSKQYKQEGWQQGRQEGLQKGWQEGRQEGLQKGWQEGRQEGRQEGWQEGRQEGLQLGEACLLQTMLAERFGPLPDEIVARIAASSKEQIEAWARQLFRASTLDEIFRA